MLYRVAGLIVGVLLLGLAKDCYTENKAFRLHGQKALIEPIDKYTVTTTTRTSKRTGKVVSETKKNEVDAYFMTADNRRVHITRTMPVDVADRLIRGQPVEITYVSNSPDKIRYDPEPASTGAALVSALLIMAFSLFFRRGE